MKIEKCFETDEIHSKSKFLFLVVRANHEVDKSVGRSVSQSVSHYNSLFNHFQGHLKILASHRFDM